MQKQVVDPAPGRFLERLQAGDMSGARGLLAADAKWFDAQTEAAVVLDGVVVPKDARVESHHNVARAAVADGGFLFVRSDGAGAITEVVSAPPKAVLVDATDSVKAYQDAWNVDAFKRSALLERGWAKSARYIDPTAEGVGAAGLATVIENFHAQFAGAQLVADAQVQPLAGGWLVFGWQAKSGSSTLDGFDVGQLDADGRVQFIAGFFSAR